MKLTAEVTAAFETLINAAERSDEIEAIARVAEFIYGKPKKPRRVRDPKNKIEIICQMCGRRVRVNNNGRNRFCSKSCARLFHRIFDK